MSIFKLCLAMAALSAAPLAHAQQKPAPLVSEELNVAELAATLQPHWVWVNDVSFTHISDGRAYLLDADKGQFLGMISGGVAHGALQLAPDGKSFSVPSTFLSRGTRGERTDVVTFYDASTLKPGKEVIIPPKRMAALPFLSAMPLSDDGRFSLIYNFTPEQSVTVVDAVARSLVGEFPTAGCALIYPTGARSFMMQCGDGSLQSMALDEGGKITSNGTSARIFAEKDPANEKPVRVAEKQWLFFTYSSTAYLVDASGKVPVQKQKWSLVSKDDAGWRIGGMQPAAYHAPSRRLFTLMHQGGEFTHKQPGTEVWVYDLKTNKRIARYKLDVPAGAIAVSGDGQPFLYAVMFGAPELRVIDAMTGKPVRTIGDMSREMSLIQPSPVPAVAKSGAVPAKPGA